MASVALKSVHKYYLSEKKTVHAVDDLNLDIADGEFVAVLGPSGCGKSSTMRMIAGLEAVTLGSILIDGREVNALSPAQRNIALAFESYALYQHMTIEENIGFCLDVRKVEPTEIKRRVHEIADLLGISDILGVRPGSLSGGKQQLVSLARAIVRKPNVILLDEPISHLDTITRLDVSMRIREIHNQTGITMIYVTHNQEEALALADRIVIMDNGRLQQTGKRDQIINEPVNTFVATFVGEPPINFIPCGIKEEGQKKYVVSPEGKIRFTLTEKQSEAIRRENLDTVNIGIRPRDLSTVKREGHYEEVIGRIHYSEFIGETTNLGVEYEKGSQIVASVAPGRDLKKGNECILYFDTNKLLIFSLSTNLRLAC